MVASAARSQYAKLDQHGFISTPMEHIYELETKCIMCIPACFG